MSSTKPLVSVIVASYNYQDYIRKTLESLVNQTYKNIEIIVVDDGSSDDSLSVISEFTKKHKNVFLYTHPNHENKGLSETIQLALKHCHGQWVAFCESDDYYDINNINEKLKFIKQHPDLDLVTNALTVNGGTVWDSRYINWTYKILRRAKKNYFSYFIPNVLIVTFSSVMIKKTVLENLDFDTPVKPWLDFWLWRQVALNGKIGFIDKKLTTFIRHPESYIHREKAEKLELNRKSFIKQSDRLLYKKHGLKFLYRRYLPYIFGRTATAEFIKYWLFGIPILTIENKFLFSHIKYIYRIFGLIPVIIRKDKITFNTDVIWSK